MRIFRLGDRGPEIHDVQQRLIALGERIEQAELDGRFGPSTERAVREFQRRRTLRVDGLVGHDTWSQLVEAGYRLGDRTLYLRAPLFRGDDVRTLQRKLNALGFEAGREDGMFGPSTDRAVREFQRNVGDEPDGIVGPETLTTIERMRPQGQSRAVIREAESLRALRRASIDGRVVAIDPGNGPAGPAAGAGEMTFAMATALADELTRAGAKPVLLRAGDEDPPPSTRAHAANELGAAVCISLHLSSDDATREPTCAYFGSAATHSPSGMILAELILEEMERELGCRGHLRRLTGAMLRETRMPAVQIEPFAQAPASEDGAKDPEFARRIGRAVAAGVRRFFAG